MHALLSEISNLSLVSRDRIIGIGLTYTFIYLISMTCFARACILLRAFANIRVSLVDEQLDQRTNALKIFFKIRSPSGSTLVHLSDSAFTTSIHITSIMCQLVIYGIKSACFEYNNGTWQNIVVQHAYEATSISPKPMKRNESLVN